MSFTKAPINLYKNYSHHLHKVVPKRVHGNQVSHNHFISQLVTTLLLLCYYYCYYWLSLSLSLLVLTGGVRWFIVVGDGVGVGGVV